MDDAKTLREKILAADDLTKEFVSVPEWGVDLYLRTMTGKERDDLESDFIKNKREWTNIRSRVVALCAVDEAGVRLFTLKEAEILGDKSGVVLTRLAEEALKVNGMRREDVEEMKGNSPGIPAVASPSS